MKLFQLIKDLISMPNVINRKASKAFDQETASILLDLKKHSPVDTGLYRKSWIVKKGSSFNQLKNLQFINTDDPGKAYNIDKGAKPNKAPWYYPGKQKERTGKLTLADGKVWPGGLKPGHSLTVGGATNLVLRKGKSEMRDRIVASIMREI